MRRALAAVAAVVLVVGAFVVRARLDDDDTEASTDTTEPGPSSSGTVVCIEELREACQALGDDVVVEPADATIARLSSSDADADRPAAWVTLAPLAQIVDENRSRNGLAPLFAATTKVGTSPLVMVARRDRGEALAAHCGGAVTWTCLGDNAGRPWSELGGAPTWGAVKPSHEPPDRTARGAVVFPWAVTSWFGSPDVATNSFSDDGFIDWATNLERAIPGGSSVQTPLEEMVLNPAKYDVVATDEAEAVRLAGPDAPRGGGFTILYPDPMGEAQAVVAETGTADTDRAGELRTALADAGWHDAEGPADARVPGLPSAGVVEALRTRVWQEVR